jgi:glycosyltransferase involved in cell wall biosynthesis
VPAVARRILIDASMARTGGGLTYLVNLLPRLVALAPERSFRVVLRGPRIELPAAPNLELVRLPEAGALARLGAGQTRLRSLARSWRADLYFSTAEMVPLHPPCPAIASFRNPNVFTALDQGWYPYQVWRLGALRQLARLSAHSCRRVLFVSHDSARWIGDSLDLSEAKRAVVHHGVDPERFAGGRAAPLACPYVLSVSSVYRYKNFVRLIEAWTLLARRRPDLPDLVIVGDDQDPDYSRRMQQSRVAAGPLAERIHLVGAVAYDEVPDWYAGARLFVFPSYLETFGHPLLEAMAAGVAVVAGDTPVSREVAGDAARYADPHDSAALAEAMAQLLDDAERRKDLVRRGRERVRGFGWERSALGHLSLFDAAVAPETGRAGPRPRPGRRRAP